MQRLYRWLGRCARFEMRPNKHFRLIWARGEKRGPRIPLQMKTRDKGNYHLSPWRSATPGLQFPASSIYQFIRVHR